VNKDFHKLKQMHSRRQQFVRCLYKHRAFSLLFAIRIQYWSTLICEPNQKCVTLCAHQLYRI